MLGRTGMAEVIGSKTSLNVASFVHDDVIGRNATPMSDVALDWVI